MYTELLWQDFLLCVNHCDKACKSLFYAAHSVTGSGALQLKYGQPNLQASNTESNLTSSSKHTRTGLPGRFPQ